MASLPVHRKQSLLGPPPLPAVPHVHYHVVPTYLFSCMKWVTLWLPISVVTPPPPLLPHPIICQGSVTLVVATIITWPVRSRARNPIENLSGMEKAFRHWTLKAFLQKHQRKKRRVLQKVVFFDKLWVSCFDSKKQKKSCVALGVSKIFNISRSF